MIIIYRLNYRLPIIYAFLTWLKQKKLASYIEFNIAINLFMILSPDSHRKAKPSTRH